MSEHDETQVRDLLERISRVVSASEWTGEINPAQWAALAYLGRANRFSRAPSQVASFLSATRGTVSQTLKALERKGLISEQRSSSDRRRVSYQLTASGEQLLTARPEIGDKFYGMGQAELQELEFLLKKFLGGMLKKGGGRAFGTCAACKFHMQGNTGKRCALLNVALKAADVNLICFEFQAAA